MSFRRPWPFIRPILMIALFAAALRVLQATLTHYRWRDVMLYLESLPPLQVVLSVVLTMAGYFFMTGYDALAFRYLPHPMPYRRIALASFIGSAFSNNIGISGLAGGSIRYRLYSAWRLSAVEIARIIVFYTITFWLGFVLLGGSLFIIAPPQIPHAAHLRLPFDSIRLLGFVLFVPAVSYLVWAFARREPVRIRQWEFVLPKPRLMLAQVLVSGADWICAAAVLYILLPDALPTGFTDFLGIFLLAQIAGVASNLPGGVGVFEAIILIFLAPYYPASAILGSLVAFRAVYYLLPLIMATILLAAHEIAEKKEGVARAAKVFGRWAPGIAPHLLAFVVFVGGAVLLLSGSTPTLMERRQMLRLIVPLPLIELSHFLASLFGALLLLLARGLQRRLDAAYHLTVIVLGAEMIFQLLKGFDYEEALVIGIMLFALVTSRRHFYRKGSFLNEGFGPGWIAAIALVLISVGWLGFFSYRHVEYSGDLWWKFEMRSDAPRFLRGAAGAAAVLLIVAMRRLMRPAAAEPTPPTAEEIERAEEIVRSDADSKTNLALLGDKSLLFSESGRAFIMYGVEGRSWIAMGDPVGDDAEKPELIWRFRELCDVHAGLPVFYQVRTGGIHLYLDAGLTLLKIGEEARVPLATFSMEGGSRKWLRKTIRRVEDEQCVFGIVPREEVALVIGELRRVSDAWLAEKKTREKSFSLGFFAPEYVARFPVAVVRKEGRIVAFANLWTSGGKEELSVDLMRHAPDAPSGVMDYMFVHLMQWGAAKGYRWFNLGVAPLSGLDNRSIAPLWNRVGALTYQFGENFYNFQGLRQYKEKFDPVWEPTYIASPGGLALPRILTHLAALIGGGVRGVFAK